MANDDDRAFVSQLELLKPLLGQAYPPVRAGSYMRPARLPLEHPNRSTQSSDHLSQNDPAGGLPLKTFRSADVTFELTRKESSSTIISQQLPAVEGADTLDVMVKTRDVNNLVHLLSNDFMEAVQGDFSWLIELRDMGYSSQEIAELLIEEKSTNPWIYFDDDVGTRDSNHSLDEFHHSPNCIHINSQQPEDIERTSEYSRSVPFILEHDGLVKRDDIKLNISKKKMLQLSEKVDENFEVPSRKTTLDEIKQRIGRGCGLAGLKPWKNGSSIMNTWVRKTIFEKSTIGNGEQKSVAIEFETNEGIPVEATLLVILDIVNDLTKVLGWMQANDLICKSFTALVLERSNFPVNIKMIVINVSVVKNFAVNLANFKFALAKPESRRSRTIESTWSNLEYLIGHCLSEFQLPTMRAKLYDALDLVDKVHFCALTSQLLCLAVLSYTNAHRAPLEPCALSCSIDSIGIYGIGKFRGSVPVVKLGSVRLTCLENMIHSRIMVFETSDTWNGGIRERYDLIARPIDLLDTWGPGQLIWAYRSGQERLCAIVIKGGTIFAKGPTLLHFTKQHKTSFELTFDMLRTYHIGDIEVNEHCQLNKEAVSRTTIGFLKTLGTKPASWSISQYQLALQGGQYIGIQAGAVWNKCSGVTVKDTILHTLFGGRANRSQLDALWALQVSVCTGVARRVSLLEMLSDVAESFVMNCAPIPPAWKTLLNSYDLTSRFRSVEFWTWFDSEIDYELQVSVVQVISYVLHSLSSTGIDHDKLVLAWTMGSDPFCCVRVPCTRKRNFWTHILVDSDSCATFAYVTTKCLETSMQPCQASPESYWQNNATLLDTAVVRCVLEHETLEIRETWSLNNQQSYWIGKSGHELVAKFAVCTNPAETRLTIQPSIVPPHFRRFLAAKRKWPRIREPGNYDIRSRKVLVLSGQ